MSRPQVRAWPAAPPGGSSRRGGGCRADGGAFAGSPPPPAPSAEAAIPATPGSASHSGAWCDAQCLLTEPVIIDLRACGCVIAMIMWAETRTTNPRAKQSWTKVAPVLHLSGNHSGQCKMTPVSSKTVKADIVNTAFTFCPGLNFPSLAEESPPRLRSQYLSSRENRLIRRTSARSCRPQLPVRARTNGITKQRPTMAWTGCTTRRPPRSVARDGT